MCYVMCIPYCKCLTNKLNTFGFCHTNFNGIPAVVNELLRIFINVLFVLLKQCKQYELLFKSNKFELIIILGIQYIVINMVNVYTPNDNILTTVYVINGLITK